MAKATADYTRTYSAYDGPAKVVVTRANSEYTVEEHDNNGHCVVHVTRHTPAMEDIRHYLGRQGRAWVKQQVTA